jgi:hypothetical protein
MINYVNTLFIKYQYILYSSYCPKNKYVMALLIWDLMVEEALRWQMNSIETRWYIEFDTPNMRPKIEDALRPSPSTGSILKFRIFGLKPIELWRRTFEL